MREVLKIAVAVILLAAVLLFGYKVINFIFDVIVDIIS